MHDRKPYLFYTCKRFQESKFSFKKSLTNCNGPSEPYPNNITFYHHSILPNHWFESAPEHLFFNVWTAATNTFFRFSSQKVRADSSRNLNISWKGGSQYLSRNSSLKRWNFWNESQREFNVTEEVHIPFDTTGWSADNWPRQVCHIHETSSRTHLIRPPFCRSRSVPVLRWDTGQTGLKRGILKPEIGNRLRKNVYLTHFRK